MGREDVSTDQNLERQLRDDTELVPEESCSEGHREHCEASKLERFAIATNHLHVSGVANRRLEWELPEESLADEIANLPGVYQYPDWQSLHYAEHEEELHSHRAGRRLFTHRRKRGIAHLDRRMLKTHQNVCAVFLHGGTSIVRWGTLRWQRVWFALCGVGFRDCSLRDIEVRAVFRVVIATA